MTPLIHAVSQEKINAVYYLIKKVGVDPTQSPEVNGIVVICW